jgi:Zn-dependent protease with chaperone function
MLIQSSIVGIVVAWYVGDVSNIAAGLPTMLLQAGYSRDHEREADAYAAAMLRFNGIPPARLGDMLAKLEAAHLASQNEAEDSPLDYLSSHPVTRERVEALRGDGTIR